jgi:hypothetical protein
MTADKKLTLFATSNETPEITTAPRARQWMDDSPSRFAYRCLPLAIANAHGWQVLNPVRFTAVWNGGGRPEDVIIKPERPHTYVPKAMFGQGTFTFHVGGVFRSPLGVNMWVTGPPNRHKHGAQPLTGVVETDWAPYSFTMNWRFTQPGIEVVFDEGEPFCFLMPISTDLLESIEPEICLMTEDEDLTGRFRAWSKSRKQWSKEKNIPGTIAFKDRWQKLYFRGEEPDGSKGPELHRTKVRVRPFNDRRGTIKNAQGVTKA